MTLEFQRLFEASPDLYLALTPDLRIVAASDAYLQATMTRRSDVLGRPLFEVFPDNPDDLTATGVRNLRASLQRVLETRRADTMQLQKYDIARPVWEGGGFEHRIWSPTNFPVLDDSGEVLYIIHRVEDVTESARVKREGIRQALANEALRKHNVQTEAKFRALMEGAPDAMVIVERGGKIQLVNTQTEKLFGYTREELLGQAIETLMPARFREAHPAHYQHFYANPCIRAMGANLDLYGQRKDGSEFPVEISLSLLETDEGTLVSSTIRDVTDRKRIEQALRDKNIALEKASRTKNLFLASMSHEIRTPLNGIIGTLDVLQHSSLMSQQLEMVDLIRDSAQSLLEIIDDILDFSKIEAGRLDIEKLPIRLADEVEKTCELLNRFAERKGATLRVFVDPAIPEVLLGDAGRVRQILINLISNAIKFSSGLPHPGRVSVRATLAERHGEHVMVAFQVTDNGIGMEEATLAKLFTSFTQADASTTRRYGGTGLGLAICKQLASLMGGEIAATSHVNEGSTFTIRLPLALAPEQVATRDSGRPLSGLCCLVVGAQGGVADDLVVYLAADGATVSRVADLAAARDWTRGSERDGVVWLVDSSDEPDAPITVHAAVPARADLGKRVPLVILRRGLRRSPRTTADGIVALDGNALSRRALTHAVAVAADLAPAEAEGRSTRPKANGAPAPTRMEAIRQHRLILVAEDNEINQKVIRQQLHLLGYANDIAANGRDALERWQSGDYALLLTDLHMPEMDGYALAMAIRVAEAGKVRAPIIALTANALRGESERCLAVGMDDYLSKPAPLSDLSAKIEQWLEPRVPAAQAGVGVAVDVSALEALIGADPLVIREVLQEFRVSAARLSADFGVACSEGRIADAATIAHTLKSSARSVGALRLAERCCEIEFACHSGELTSLTALRPGFEAELAAAEEYLGNLLLPDPQAQQCA